MSILLDDASSQHLLRTASVPTLTFPFAMQCAVKLDDLSLQQCLMGIFNSGSSGNFHALVFDGTAGGNPVVARSRSATTDGDAVSTVGVGSVTYKIVTGIWISASEREIYLDGIGFGNNTDTRVVTGLDSLALGVLNKSVLSLYMSGQIADVAIWSNLTGGFSAADIEQLGVDRISPLLIRDDKLIFWAPLPAATPDPAVDTVGGYDLGLVNSPTTGDDSPDTETFDPPTAFPPPFGNIDIAAETVATCEQEALANIKGAPASNTCAASVGITSNIIASGGVESTAGAFAAGAITNIIQIFAGSACSATVAADHNVVEATASSTESSLPEVTSNVKQGSAASSCAASVDVTENVTEASAENTCGATANAGREINATAFSNAACLQTASTNQVDYPEIEHVVTCSQEVGLQVTHNINIVHACPSEAKANRAVEATATTTATATAAAFRGDDATSIVTATPSASGETCSYASSTCGATVEASATIERNLAITSTCGATVTAHGFLVTSGCDLHTYNPQGAATLPSVSLSTRDTILLVCGSDSVALRNPSFGNEDTLEIVRSLSQSRQGTYSTFRDPTWPKSQTKTFSVGLLKRIDAQDLLDFQLNCLGKEITYTDMEDREWIGTLINPEQPLIANFRDQYTVNFEFRGVLTTEKVW